MYRPEGMKENPYEAENDLRVVYSEQDMNKAFEAGADAMLEGIWKMAKESPTGTFTFDTHVINCPSVFLPEEESELQKGSKG